MSAQLPGSGNELVALFKLGEERHMRAQVSEGLVYLNSLGYFRKLEASRVQADPDEATGYCWQMPDSLLEIQVEETWQTLGRVNGGIRSHDELLNSLSVFCLHGRHRQDCVDPRVLADLGLGATFVLFSNPNEFFRRLYRAAMEEYYQVQFGPVEYVDRFTYNGPMGAFRKFKERERESEFRVVLSPGDDEPITSKLGSLQDVAIIGSADERLKLTPSGK